MDVPEEDSAQISKRQAIQAIMRDTSLTPQEKQLKIQEFMAGGGKVDEPAQVDGPVQATAAPQTDSDAIIMSKQEQYKAIMSDTSLSMEEKHERFKEIMSSSNGSLHTGSARDMSAISDSPLNPRRSTSLPFGSQGDGGGAIFGPNIMSPPSVPISTSEAAPPKQELAQEVVQESSTQKDQEKGGQDEDNTAEEKPKTKQDLIREVMKDSSLAPQERQQKVRDIMAGPPPGQSNSGTSQQVEASPRRTPVAAKRPLSVPSSPLVGAAAISPATVDPVARKMQRESSRNRSSTFSAQSPPGGTTSGPMRPPGGPQIWSLRPPIGEGDNNADRPQVGAASAGAAAASTVGASSSTGNVDPAARKLQREASRGSRRNHPAGSGYSGRSLLNNSSRQVGGANNSAGASSAMGTVDPATRKLQRESSRGLSGSRRNQMTGAGNTSGRSVLNGGPSSVARANYQPPMHTMSMTQPSAMQNGNLIEEQNQEERNGAVSENQPAEGPASSGEVQETEDNNAEEGEGVASAAAAPADIAAYVADQDPNAVAASGVVTEEQIQDEENSQKARFLCGGICCFCIILVIAIVVPLFVLAPKEENPLVLVEIPSESPTPVPTLAPSVSPTPGAVLELLMELELLYPNTNDYVASFNNSNTVQNQALLWAAGEGNPGGLISGSDPRMIRRFALATFYFATNGDDWARCTRDGSNCSPGQEWLLAEDECGWLAITCDDDTSDVTQIFFPPTGQADGNNVAGSLPFELGLLTNLKRITISRNNIGGSIPSSWTNLTTLEAIILSDNRLTGELPSSLINNNQGLRQLRLSGNRISQLPQDSLGSAGLTTLDLQDNALEGPIPEGIQGLSALQTLDLRGNNLNSTLPESLFQIETLRNLYLADNALSGNISASFGALTDIRRVELTGNDFTGAIPDGLCALKSDPAGSLQLLTADCDEVVCACCDNDCTA